MKQKPTKKLAYPIQEAFQLIGAKPSYGYQLIAQGRLKTYKRGRNRLATHEACEDFIAQEQREYKRAGGAQ